MSKVYYYKKSSKKRVSKKGMIRIFGLCLSVCGIIVVGYIFTPIILWQLFIAPVFASQSIAVPIPQTTLVTPGTLKTLLAAELHSLLGVDDTDAKNWFPNYIRSGRQASIPSYTISIPKLSLENLVVSTVDTDLAHHLVQLDGTSTPPDKGNVVIFGHSTLPSLFNPKDYKTIFANIQNLKVGDTIIVNVNNIIYTYNIFSITIIEPDDTSVLGQNLDDSYLTLITCTPPGTIWKRLVIKARIQTI